MPYCIVAFFYRLAYWLVRGVLWFYYDIRVEGKENRPKGTAAIFASNHRSYLDPVLVVFGCPHPFNYIAKEELFQIPLLRPLIRMMGAFPATDSNDPNYNMLDEAAKRLHKRRHMVIFPEGTRHTNGKVGRGKIGVCLLSAKSGKPVIPVGLIFNSNNLHFRSKICIRLGKPIYPSEYGITADSNPHEMHAMRSAIMTQIKALVEENPPFPIVHDQPKKLTAIEQQHEQRKKELEERRHTED